MIDSKDGWVFDFFFGVCAWDYASLVSYLRFLLPFFCYVSLACIVERSLKSLPLSYC